MTRILAAAVSALLAVPACAHDYTGDLICKIRDNSGQTNLYAFADNTKNANGTIGGTFVETGYTSTRRSVAAPAGMRPVWIYSANDAGGITIASRADPGWFIVVGRGSQGNGVFGGDAVLMHGARAVGWGECARRSASTAATVPDMGGE